MSRRLALIVTSGLTMFVLLTVSALVFRAASYGQAVGAADDNASQTASSTATLTPAAASAKAAATSTPISTADSPVPASVWQERERIYQERLDQANAQLQEAYRHLQQLQAQQQDQQPQPAQTEGDSATSEEDEGETLSATTQPDQQGQASMITSEQASQIAVAYLGGGKVKKVELEREDDQAVYVVKVDGAKVIVDAYTGEVIVSSKGQPSLARSYDERRDHEREEQEDD